MRNALSILALVAVLAIGVVGHADSIGLWDGITTDNPGDTVTGIDDATVDRVDGTGDGTSTTLQYEANTRQYILFGFKDLFTELPGTSGGADIVIESATLQIATSTTKFGQCRIGAVVTPWLVNAAGSSETNVTGQYSDAGNLTTWASGNFSTTDIDIAGATGDLGVLGGNDIPSNFDVTTITQAMYDGGTNQGLAMWATYDGSIPTFYSTESVASMKHPLLTIEYHYEAIPEPGTMLLLGTGALGLFGYLRRRKMR